MDAGDLIRRLPMAAAVDALAEGFATRRPPTPIRAHHHVPDGSLLVMPAAGPEGVGVKLVTLAPANPSRGLPFIQGAYALFDPGTLAPAAVIDGGALTALRTAAVSGLATRYLARPDAETVVIFGAGVQGNSHFDAMVAVRDVRRVVVVSRSEEPAQALVDRARSSGYEATVGDPAAVSDADIVCTCTTSETPLFDGSLLPQGVHVNAVGAFQPHTRELDTATIVRSRVVVEERTAALEEAGDLVIAIDEGAVDAAHIVADLREVVEGAVVRRSDDDVTVFKSVGIAFEDLVVARACVGSSP